MAFTEQIAESPVDAYEMADHEKTAMGAYAGLIVKRDRLLHELAEKGRSAGITVVSAPRGYGKTALVLQYASIVQADPARGGARVVDGEGLGREGLANLLDELESAIVPGVRPLLAIDDLPRLDREAAGWVVERLRALREQGYEVVVTCLPSNRQFLSTLGDSAKISSRALAVHPREYSEWVKVFTIAGGLDVYELTQGIPALVALLCAASGRKASSDALDEGIVEVHEGVLGELRRERDTLYRIVCMMLLMERGRLDDLERCGMRVQRETVARLARDYPLFGLDTSDRSFACLGRGGKASARIRRDIAARRPAFAGQAVRVLMRCGRVDDAVELCRLVMDAEQTALLIARFPTRFALAGHAAFIFSALSEGETVASSGVDACALLALYVAALTAGNYRMARSCAAELRRRADEICEQIDACDWDCACAMQQVWGSCTGIDLPEMPVDFVCRQTSREAEALRLHARVYAELVGGGGNPRWDGDVEAAASLAENRIDIPGVLLKCDRLLELALHGEGASQQEIEELEGMVEELVRRRLVAIAARVRMTVNTCRFYRGLPIIDERGFVDAGTIAVREADLSTQLYCLAAEGWQSLAVGQASNARFRGQQVTKLAVPENRFLHAWGLLLECSAHLRETSRVRAKQEAEALDLTQGGDDAGSAWATALRLAAARFDAELAAWYSLNKTVMVDPRIAPIVRRAAELVGSKCESIAPFLSPAHDDGHASNRRSDERAETLREIVTGLPSEHAGEVVINLFGGFHAERNGHVLTDGSWRRKKASVIAARLALNLGSFVSRRAIIDELWPDAKYSSGRESLYVTLSALRTALGQRAGGPQYLLTQGDGLALNAEYVYADVRSFDLLARGILLRSEETSAQQVVELCLKLEELYAGPLYVPDRGDTAYFTRMRALFASRFADCMAKGIDAALELDNLSCAAWLVEAALRHVPAREDLIRRAMEVYDRCGRRREVVTLYNSHLHYLQHEVNALPEAETRALYERIVNRSKAPLLI